MTSRGHRGLARHLAAAGGLLVLAAIPSTTLAQESPAAFVGYQAEATGTALSAFPTLPSLLPVEVPFEATVALATATLASGGEGFGRASTFFPGTLTAGLRPLIEIGAGTRLPLPDYPLVVESRQHEGAKHSDVPGISMSTDVDPDRALAVADAGGIGLPAVVGVGSFHTESRAELEVGRITATSTTTLHGINLAGTVAIDSIVVVASVTSDGTTSTCSGGATISGVTVNGSPATIDEEGIHLDQQAPSGGVGADKALAQALAGSGVTARTFDGIDGCTTAVGSRTSVGLLVTLPLPAGGSIPPGGGLSVVLGSTAASAGGSTFAADAPAAPDADPTLGDVVSRLPGPFTGGGVLAPIDPAVPIGSAPTGTAGPASTGFVTQDVAYAYDGLPASLVVGLLLLAVAGSGRLRRYMRRIIGLIDST